MPTTISVQFGVYDFVSYTYLLSWLYNSEIIVSFDLKDIEDQTYKNEVDDCSGILVARSEQIYSLLDYLYTKTGSCVPVTVSDRVKLFVRTCVSPCLNHGNKTSRKHTSISIFGQSSHKTYTKLQKNIVYLCRRGRSTIY